MKRVFVMFYFLMLVLPLCSSTIIFNEDFDSLYNIGDMININFSLESGIPVSDFVETTLECNSEKFVVRKEYLKMDVGVKKFFSFEFPAPINGDCEIFVSFNDETAHSNEFEISDELLINYNLNDVSFLPGDTVIVNGTVEKKNGDSFNGTVMVEIPGIFEKSVEIKKNGEFSINFNFPIDAPPNDHDLIINSFEKDWKGDILNSGSEIININIKSKPTSIIINSIDVIKPPYNFSLTPELVNQVGGVIDNETLLVRIFNPLNDLVFEQNILSGEAVFYFFEENAIKGGWNINAYYGNIFFSKPVYIGDNKKITINVVGNNVVIENKGNAVYEGVVKFNLRNDLVDDDFFVNVSLDVGEILKYPLDIEGTYNLSSDEINLENVYFPGTGASIFINPSLSPKSYFIAFGILILAGVVIFLFRKGFFKKLKSKGRKKPEKVSTRKIVFGKTKVCMIFLKFDSFPKIDSLIEKYKFSLKKFGDNGGYILFYSSPEKRPEAKMFNFVRDLRKTLSSNEKFSAVINSSTFFNTKDFLKNFASLTRKLLDFSNGDIIVPKKVFDKIGVHQPKRRKIFNIEGKLIEVYAI